MKKVVAFLVMAVLPALFSKPALFAGPTDTNSPNGNIEQTNKQDNSDGKKLTVFQVENLEVTGSICDTLHHKDGMASYQKLEAGFMLMQKENRFSASLHAEKTSDIEMPRCQRFKNADEMLGFIGNNFAGENKKILSLLINIIGKDNISEMSCQDLKNNVFALAIRHKYPYLQMDFFKSPVSQINEVLEKMKELSFEPVTIITEKSKNGFIVVSNNKKHQPIDDIKLSKERNNAIAKGWETKKDVLIEKINEKCIPPGYLEFAEFKIKQDTRIPKDKKDEELNNIIEGAKVASPADENERINLGGTMNFVYEVIIDTTNPAKTYSDIRKAGAFWGQITKNKTGKYRVKAYYNMKLHPGKLFE